MKTLRYPCLVLDHDDTTVDSTALIHYPAFLACAQLLRPGQVSMSLEEYFSMNAAPGLFAYYKDVMGLSSEELEFEHRFWMDYVASHVPAAYEGIGKILREQRERGGQVCVVSHSRRENILRDWRENGLGEPDLVYGAELPEDRQKPSPWPLFDIMERLSLAPGQLLVVDDLPWGREMAAQAGVAFAAAGWAHGQLISPEGELRFNTPAELYTYLFDA